MTEGLVTESLGHEGTTGKAPFEGLLIRGSAGTGADLQATYWYTMLAAMEEAGWIVVWTYGAGGPHSGFVPFVRGSEQCEYTQQGRRAVHL